MHYIVVDFEWNQNPYTALKGKKDIPFEIIEIGAVKLNDQREITERFDVLIKPQIYNEIHYMTKEIIQLTMDDLKNGESFPTAVKNFFHWCGENYRFCTWGDTDLIELHRNLEYYKLESYIDKPIPYYDVQKLFALNYEGRKNPRTLEKAVDMLSIKKEEGFHRACNDAEYTALVFQKLNIDVIQMYYSMDFFYNPKRKEEEINLIYDTYSKYISMEYQTKEELMQDKEVRSCVCYKCGRRAAKKIRWFSTNPKQYYCLAFCREHGYIKGKIRIKKAASGNVFAIKVLKLVDEEESAEIREKREELLKKRRRKKKKV